MNTGSAYEALIVGGGAAGLNAALVLGRSRRRVLLCDDGHPRNRVAELMHGFLTRDGTPPDDLLRIGREELQRYPTVEVRETRVTRMEGSNGHFVGSTETGQRFAAPKILLATGVRDALPSIDGLEPLWGRSVFVCPYCDGWEVRDQTIAVVGKGRRAVELAQELRQWSSDVIACVEGDDKLSDHDRRWLEVSHTRLRRSPIRTLHGAGSQLESIEYEDGEREKCDAIFLCAPLRQQCPIASMLGCRMTRDNEIAVDLRGRTSVDGCFAAGDAVTNVHQVILAAASGVCAAMALNEALLAQEVTRAIQRVE